MGKYWRNIRTTQEMRWIGAHEPYVRGKRRNLPTDWDDIRRKDISDRSWKSNTKFSRQWMKGLRWK